MVSNRWTARAANVEARLNEAPLRAEREMFLTHLREQGTTEEQVRILATRVVEINRLLGMTKVRMIHTSELEESINQELQNLRTHKTRKVAPSTAFTLRTTAKKWLRFNECLVVMEKPAPPFDGILLKFATHVQSVRGEHASSLRNLLGKVGHFLDWAAQRHSAITEVTLNDIDDWFHIKRQAGMQPRSVAAYSNSLRAFYRWANVEGWTEQKIAVGLKSPPIPPVDRTPKGPSWKDVRRLIDSITGDGRAALRCKAVVLLCSVYGLRNIEVRRLTLDDFNWETATMTVRRAKGGRLQQFPLQYEVGEAILRYLIHGRPKCKSRTLLLTIRPPFREVHGCVLPQIIRHRLEKLNVESEYKGAHALRHACATELLHQGSSLVDIAGFLGHKRLSSVSIYAKLDERSLRMVSDFSIQGVL